MPDIGYFNGKFMTLDEVRISPDDRGYQFGDGIYEVVTVYEGIPFVLEEHLSRLDQSAQEIRLSLPNTHSELENRIMDGVQRSGYQNCKVYIQVTRGVAPRDHQFPSMPSPTILMTFREMGTLDESLRQRGVKTITVPDVRWGRCDIKSLNLLPNVLAKQQAKESGAFEAIFVREGIVSEGTSSNVMMIRGQALYTPERNHRILAGVTRKIVLELAKKEGLRICEGTVGINELFEADELLLVGTTIEVLPVIAVNEKPVGTGSPGPLTQRLLASYQELIRNLQQA